MATIGLDGLYYSKITEGTGGAETYGTPVRLAKAIKADITINANSEPLYADDGISEQVDEFKDGTISLGVDDIGSAVAVDLVGVTVDNNGVVISTSEDVANYVAVGFRARKSNGKYRYFWLYRVKFSVPAVNLATKAGTITFSTPTIEGKIMRRNKPDTRGRYPWKAEVTDGEPGVSAATVSGWFSAVYEPSYASSSQH